MPPSTVPASRRSSRTDDLIERGNDAEGFPEQWDPATQRGADPETHRL